MCYLNFQGSKGSCHGNQIWAKISHNCTELSSVKISRHFLPVGCSCRGRRIQICYLNFLGSIGRCHGNQIWAKISHNCTDFSSVKISRPFLYAGCIFRSCRIQICYLNFHGSTGSCYGNQIWAKISHNCTDFSSVKISRHFLHVGCSFRGRRIQTCYSNFQGTKGRCHGNQIWEKNNPKLH